MKKILKKAIILLSVGIIATPAFAAEWGVSGQVRVDWNIINSSETDASPEKTSNTAADLSVGADDTFVKFSLNGDNGSGSIAYFTNGRVEYSGSTSGEEDGWSYRATATVRHEDDGVEGGGLIAKDQFIALNHESGFYLKVGNFVSLYNFKKGLGNLLIGNKDDIGILDTRAEVGEFGFDIGENFTIALVIEDVQNGVGNTKAFGAVEYGDGDNALATTKSSSRNTGIKANFVNDVVNVGFTSVTGSAVSKSAEGGSDDISASASATGFGIALSLGAFSPYFNYFAPSGTFEQGKNKEEVSTATTLLGVAFGPFGAAVQSQATTNNDVESKNNSFELGYNGKFGDTAFKVGYLTKTANQTDKSDGTTTQNLKLRLQRNF